MQGGSYQSYQMLGEYLIPQEIGCWFISDLGHLSVGAEE
jgi:hypothetical protein